MRPFSQLGNTYAIKIYSQRLKREDFSQVFNKMMKVKTTAVKNFINERFDNESAISALQKVPTKSAHKNND